jgi:hypothetical protein
MQHIYYGNSSLSVSVNPEVLCSNPWRSKRGEWREDREGKRQTIKCGRRVGGKEKSWEK